MAVAPEFKLTKCWACRASSFEDCQEKSKLTEAIEADNQPLIRTRMVFLTTYKANGKYQQCNKGDQCQLEVRKDRQGNVSSFKTGCISQAVSSFFLN